MSIINTTLTNTILVPTHDSLVSSHPLSPTTIVKDVQQYNTAMREDTPTTADQFGVYFKDKSKSVKAAFCEKVEFLSVSRKVDAVRSGGNANYVVKLPGPVEYPTVTLVQLYTDNEIFLDWMINGAEQGGVKKIDIEIRVGTDANYVVYTLRDAFPVAWNFGTMTINMSGLVTGGETLTYSIKAGELLVENLKVDYGKLEYKTVKAAGQ